MILAYHQIIHLTLLENIDEEVHLALDLHDTKTAVVCVSITKLLALKLENVSNLAHLNFRKTNKAAAEGQLA